MEINSTVKKSEDEGFLEMPVEGLDAQLDDILDEVVDLAQDMRAEELIQVDLAPGEEGAGEEANDETQAIDDLELEIELPEESTELQAGIEHEAKEAESTLDALIDAENEIMSTLSKESVASDTEGTTKTATSKDAGDRGIEKARSGLCSTSGEEAAEPLEKTVMPKEAADGPPALDYQLSEDLPVNSEMEQDSKEDNVSFAKAPSIAEKSSDELLSEVELENVLEAGQTNAGGTSRLSASDDELAALITEQMEAFVTSLVEERMSAIVERIITEKITNIFAFMK